MGKMERSTDDGAVSADGEVAKEVSSRRTSSNAWCMAGCEADRHVRALSGRIEALRLRMVADVAVERYREHVLVVLVCFARVLKPGERVLVRGSRG